MAAGSSCRKCGWNSIHEDRLEPAEGQIQRDANHVPSGQLRCYCEPIFQNQQKTMHLMKGESVSGDSNPLSRKDYCRKSDDGANSAYRRPEIARLSVYGFAASIAALSMTRL
jgi:hypothetical protein